MRGEKKQRRKATKKVRDSHMRGIYEILGKEEEVKICKVCKVKFT